MLKKQGVVEPKLTSKPSFKNIMNLSEAKIPSRSKSKSKSTSQIKVGTVPNKSPRKTIQCPNDSNNVLTNSPRQQNHMSYESELSREQTSNMARYDDAASEISRSKNSRSPKKDSGKEHMRQVVLLKNKTVQLEQAFKAIFQSAKVKGYKIQKEGKIKVSLNASKKMEQSSLAYPQLKISQSKIDSYLAELKGNCEKTQQKYNNQFDQLAKNTQSENICWGDIMERFQRRQKITPNMPQLQSKLSQLYKLLN